MSDLFRFAAMRSPQKLSDESKSTLGLKLYNDGDASARIMTVFPLFQENDHEAIYNFFVTFLKSSDSISNESQLSDPVKDLLKVMRGKKKKLRATDVNGLIPTTVLAPYFTPKGGATLSDFQIEKQAVEDTMMALTFIGKLGNSKNIDLQLIYRALQILKALNSGSGSISEGVLREFMNKPIIVANSRYNPCAQKLETIEPYQHLGLKTIEEPESPPEGGKATAEDECDCGCGSVDCQNQSTCCVELRPFIADLMLVREELKYYKPHHLAYIETIMLGESRKREHRTLDQLETYQETETETSKSVERDHEVEDRFSLKSQINKTLEQDIELEAGVRASADFGAVKIETDFGFSMDSSKNETYELAREYARNVVTRSVTKVEEKVRQLNSTRRLSEVEEKNTHEFVNDSGEKHINGQYHYVNMINKAQVMNYGKRLMIEAVLPEPMEMYKKLLEKEVLPFGQTEPEKPKIRIDQIQQGPKKDDDTPVDSFTDSSGAITYSDTGIYNYQELMKYYALSDIDPLPDPDIRLPFTFENATKVEGEDEILTFTTQIGQVPSGYNARLLTVDIKAFDTESDVPQIDLQWFANGASGGVVPHSGLVAQQTTVNMSIDATQDTQLSMAVMAKSAAGVAGSGVVTCLLSDQAKIVWKTKVWEKIMEKYEQDLQEYTTALARYEQDKKARLPFGNNPFINREIESTELKRLAISYISCQFYDSFDAMKRNVKPCGYPEMNIPEAKTEGDFIRFFEQVFQWNLMTYLFYPYFWGKKCSWPEKVQTYSGDPLFDKALMAGAARVQIPVRPGMEALAMHWFNYGEIWEGASEPPIAGDDYYLSMAQEIKEQKNCFYQDREGVLKACIGSNQVELTGTDYYWDYISIPTGGTVPGMVNTANIEADLNREIIINCEVYRIVAILEVASADHDQWTIVLDRPFDGKEGCGCKQDGVEPEPGDCIENLPYQTGAVFVGAPFEVTVPTNLIYLRNVKVGDSYVIADCLPCYPIDKCE